jgi:hypothetical protein
MGEIVISQYAAVAIEQVHYVKALRVVADINIYIVVWLLYSIDKRTLEIVDVDGCDIRVVIANVDAFKCRVRVKR